MMKGVVVTINAGHSGRGEWPPDVDNYYLAIFHLYF